MKKTALYDTHVKLGGKIVDFAGFLMPMQYSNIIDEHQATRQKAGLFDLSHMGEILITDSEAEAFLGMILTGDIKGLSEGRTLYTFLCNEKGGILDDLIVYRMGRERFMLVVNASNIEKDFNWIMRQARELDVLCHNLSDEVALIALQGPASEAILKKTPYQSAETLKRNHFLEFGTMEDKLLISRTGYTGEDGFEIYLSNRIAPAAWEALMKAGESQGLKPIGLGARDTLRLEARLPLYGHDLDDTTTPLEAGFGWTVDLKKDFVGKNALAREAKEGIKKTLIGFEMLEKAIPRQGCAIWKEKEIGKVTSGTFSPTLQKNIGLGYLPPEHSQVGTEIFIEVREKKLKARIVKTPFYKKG